MMGFPRWVDHGHIEIPASAVVDGVRGDGVKVIGEDDDAFGVWKDWMDLQGMERPER